MASATRIQRKDFQFWQDKVSALAKRMNVWKSFWKKWVLGSGNKKINPDITEPNPTVTKNKDDDLDHNMCFNTVKTNLTLTQFLWTFR